MTYRDRVWTKIIIKQTIILIDCQKKMAVDKGEDSLLLDYQKIANILYYSGERPNKEVIDKAYNKVYRYLKRHNKKVEKLHPYYFKITF
jgi:hypothetical protein